jgi:hypothetical protein
MTEPTKEVAPWAKDAWFVLSIYGNGEGTSLHYGWEAICEAVSAVPYPDADQRAKVMARLTDWEEWDNIGAPWRWAVGYKGGSVTVERVTNADAIDAHIAQRVAEAVERTRERCELAAYRAKLPPDFQWGEEARDNFDFGKEQAARAIRTLKELR